MDGFPEYTNVLRDRCYIVDEGKKKKLWSMLKQVMFSKEDKSKMYSKYTVFFVRIPFIRISRLKIAKN